MTLNDFIKKYDGQQVEVAGSANAKYQCVDLVNLYIRDVLSLPIIEWTDAKDFPKHADSNYTYIKASSQAVPKYGDIVVWNGNVGGGHGHIAIFLSGTGGSFTSFDQNWSTALRCKIENHRYNNVDGWLHPKQLDIIQPVEITDQTRIPQITDKNGIPMEVQQIRSVLNDQKRDIKNFKQREEEDAKLLAKINEDEGTNFNSLPEVGKAYQETKTDYSGPLAKLGRSLDERFKLGPYGEKVPD